jgi:hypothetical protein
MTRDVHRWVIVDDVMVSLTRPGQSADAVWHAFAKDLSSKGVAKYLGTAIGTAEVNSVQRKIVADVLMRRNIPVAAVTDDRIVRGLITAVSWMGVNIKAFGWAELREAILHLRVPQGKVEQVIQAVNGLRDAQPR